MSKKMQFIPQEDRESIATKKGIEVEVAGFEEPDKFLCWIDIKGDFGSEKAQGVIGLAARAFDVESLKSSNLWKRLSEDIQKSLEEVGEKEDAEKPKRGRQRDPRNAGFPSELVCTVCDEPKKAAPCQIRILMDKREMTLEELQASYICRVCKGKIRRENAPPEPIKAPKAPKDPNAPVKRRGRAPNPANADVPKKMMCCICKNPKGTTPVQYRKVLAASGLGREEFLATYKCKSCKAKEKKQ